MDFESIASAYSATRATQRRFHYIGIYLFVKENTISCWWSNRDLSTAPFFVSQSKENRIVRRVYPCPPLGQTQVCPTRQNRIQDSDRIRKKSFFVLYALR